MSTEQQNPLDFNKLESSLVEEGKVKPSITPTLVVGIGGTGTDAVRYLKRRLVWLWHREEIEQELERIPIGKDPKVWQNEVWRRFEMEGGPPIIQFLAVDTWPWNNHTGQVYLNDHEYAYIGGYNASRVLENLKNHSEISSWWRWPSTEIKPGQIHSGARQIRAIGRLSFYRRYREFQRKLIPQLDKISSLQAKQDTEDRGYQVAPSGATKHVYIICSICGGTGAGAYLDTAAVLRSHFSESAIITGIFALPSVFLPDISSDLQKHRIQANAYAALKEITYFQSNEYHFKLPGEKAERTPGIFNRLYLVERVNEVEESLNSIDDVKKLIANQIFLESITDVGSRIWEYDVNVTMERRRKEGKLSAYIFSSFANSSLLVPQDEMFEYCELKYAEELIREGLLREISPDDKNQLTNDADLSFGRLRDLINRTPSDEFVLDGDDLLFDLDGDEFGNFEDHNPGNNTKEIGILEQFQQDVNRIIEQFGLQGGLLYLQTIASTLNSQVTSSREIVNVQRNNLQSISARLAELNTRQPAAVRWNVWPFSLFVRAAVRTHRRELAALRRNDEDANLQLSDAIQERDGWTRLHGSLGPLLAQLEERVKILESICLQLHQDRERLFATVRTTELQPFEMFSFILGRDYIERKLYPEARKKGLDGQLLQDSAGLLITGNVCKVELVTSHVKTAGGSAYERIIQLTPIQQELLYREISNIARKSTRERIRRELFDIRSILNSHHSKLQTRLRDLFTRCRPFWRYDLDRGGISERDLEPIIFTGVPESNHRDWKHLLRDFPDFSLVETDDPTRIDACRIMHGLPIEYLKSIADFKDKYDRFFNEFTGPLQLDAHWEPEGDNPLPELVGDPPKRNTIKDEKSAVSSSHRHTKEDLPGESPLPPFPNPDADLSDDEEPKPLW